MSFVDFSTNREFFFYSNRSKKVQALKPDLKKLSGSNGSFSLFRIKFLRPRLLKNFDEFSDFPFLALSNGSLLFYDSAYINFLFESSFAQSGLLLFDDLYSYKNKIIF